MKRRVKRRVNRTKREWFKAKVAFILLIVAIALANSDCGIVFQLIAVFALLWMRVCVLRLVNRGAIQCE